MANVLYDWGRDAFANGLIAWTTDTIQIIAVSSAYTPNFATDKFLSDITGTLGSAQTLATKSTAAGAIFAGAVTFTGITNGSIIAGFVIYKSTGVAGTSRLIGFINVAAGLPCTSIGGNIICTFFGNEVCEL